MQLSNLVYVNLSLIHPVSAIQMFKYMSANFSLYIFIYIYIIEYIFVKYAGFW